MSPPPSSTGTRELMLGWCLWLLGTWAVTLTLGSPLPAVRWMVIAAVVGLVAVWPAFRLSQEAPPGRLAPVGLILLDWVCLMLVFQAVVWPLRLVASWSYPQALWLDAAIAAWSLAAGGVVAAGRAFDAGWARAAAMAVCLLLLLGEPVLLLLFAGGDEPAWRASPIPVVWHLTGRVSDLRMGWVAPSVIAAAAAAALLWLGLLLSTGAAFLASRHGRPRAASHPI